LVLALNDHADCNLVICIDAPVIKPQDYAEGVTASVAFILLRDPAACGLTSSEEAEVILKELIEKITSAYIISSVRKTKSMYQL